MSDEIEITLTNAIISFISIEALFCAVLIFFIIPKNQLRGKPYLVLYFISFSIVYFFLVYNTRCYCEGMNWTLVRALFSEIKIIMLYLFIQTSLMKTFKISGWHYLIFTSLIMYFILNILHIMRFEIDLIHNMVTSSYHFVFELSFFLVVVFISLLTINKYKQTILQTKSSAEIYQYKWIRFMLYATIVFNIFPIIWNALYHFTSIEFDRQFLYIVFGILAFIYLISILITALLNFRNTIPIHVVPELDEIIDNKETIKEITLEHQAVFDKIMNKIESEKIYTNSELNITVLAEMVQESQRMVSESINYCAKTNFYSFINAFRIQEAQRILVSNNDDKLTVLEVMYAVGYNSKSSFYSTFKNIVGETPSTYRKKFNSKMSSDT